MSSEFEPLFAVIQFGDAGQRTIRRVIAPFPDRGSAATFAIDNELRYFAVGPMEFAVPTGVPVGMSDQRPDGPPAAVSARSVGRVPAQRTAIR